MAPHVKRQVCRQTLCKCSAHILKPFSWISANVCGCLQTQNLLFLPDLCRVLVLPASCSSVATSHLVIFSDFCSSAAQMAPRHFCSDLPWSLLLTADIYLIITRWAKVTRRLTLSNTHSWSPKGPETTFPHFWMSADLSCYLSLLVSLCRRWFHPALKITLMQRPSVGFYSQTRSAWHWRTSLSRMVGQSKKLTAAGTLSLCFITSCFVVSAKKRCLIKHVI